MSYDMLQKAENCFAYMSMLIELANGNRITGYDIIVLNKQFGFNGHPGSIYHHLNMLAEEGLVREETQRRGKTIKTVYEMTDEGKVLFHEFKQRWKKPLEYVAKNLQ
jgi:DNA-binding PadR family transcriptional regulator